MSLFSNTVNKPDWPIWTGVILWLVFAILQQPTSPTKLAYVTILIAAAPLFLIPLAWQTIALPDRLQLYALPAAFLFTYSFLLPTGWIAGAMTLPWLTLTVVLAFLYARCWWNKGQRGIASICQLAAFLYLPVGGAWGFAHRIDFGPMGFDQVIVLLTVAHFHYAGFILPTITGHLFQFNQFSIHKMIGWGVVFGVPLVALGITGSQFDWPVWIEVVAASIMATAGLLIGISHFRLGLSYRRKYYGWSWMTGGIALSLGMCLALLYGWRYYMPIAALSIPQMYALHGTLNAIGFALPGILGWAMYSRQTSGTLF